MKIMGILNVTNDSFSDANMYLNKDDAIRHAMNMIEDGADIIDIGGESSRPGAKQVDTKIEIERVVPIIKELKRRLNNNVYISIDTYKSEVAKEALEAGSDMINDIYALSYDQRMIEILKLYPHVKIILMHMQGTPETMQVNPVYNDIISEINKFFDEKINHCLAHGIPKENIILDPGIGFGKTYQHNLDIFKYLDGFKSHSLPILIGASRKSFLKDLYTTTILNPQERLIPSLATTVVGFNKKIEYIRVHDVKQHKQMIDALKVLC